MKSIPNGKPVFLEDEKNHEIERQNKLLFEKIENIINRQGPYKKQ